MSVSLKQVRIRRIASVLAATSILGAGLIGLSPTAFADTQYGTQLVGGLNFPGQIAFEPNGKVLVGVFRSSSMIEYDPATQSSTSIDLGDYSNGVAIAPDGTTYFSDNDGQVSTLDLTTHEVTVLPLTGLSRPAGLATDADGNLLIADSGSNQIEEYNPHSEVVTPLVTSGLNHPVAVAVAANGDLYIADEYDRAIKKWDGDTLSTVIAADEPTSVVLDAAGNVVYSQLFDASLHSYNPGTGVDTKLAGGGWSGIAVAPDGTRYATTQQAFYRLDDIAAPSAPYITGSSTTSTSATLTFDAPADLHGSTVTGYETSIDGTSWQPATVTGTDTLSTTVSGLTRDTDYTVQLRADSPAGASDADSVDLTTAFDVPSAPRNIVPTPGGGKIGFTLDAPADNGGTAVTGYEYSVDGTNWTPVTVTDGAGVITGLDNGTAYTVQLRAENSAGDGAAATAEKVTVSPDPSAVQSLTLTPQDGSIGFSFSAPKFDGDSAVDHYEYSLNGGTWNALGVSNTDPFTGTLGGLSNGTSYDVSVRAVNADGSGAAEDSVAVPRTTPDTPASIAAAPGDGALTLTFDTPADGGSEITGYEVSTDNGNTFSPVTASVAGLGRSQVTVSGLTNGQSYALRLRADNAAGFSAAALVDAATPYTSPSAMNISGAGGISHGFYLYFNAPLDTGGSDVTGYQVSLDGGSTWRSLDTAPGDGYLIGTVQGLDNGTSYDIQTRAVNAAGGGTVHDFGAFTPLGAASAPTIASVTPGDSALTVSFDAPDDNGGAAIDHYETSTDGGVTWQPLTVTGSTVLTGTVGDLDNGTSYVLQLRAENGSVDGVAAIATAATPVSVPSAPVTVTAKAGAASIALTFAAPTYDTGLPVLRYETSSDGGTTWVPANVTDTASVLSTTVTGLTNGTTYRLQLRAVNEAGPGLAATAVPVTPEGVASAPVDVRVESENGALDVTFSPPVDDGGSPVNYYEYSIDGGSSWNSVYDFNHNGLVSVPVPGLTNGMSYTVLVRGVNNAGIGAYAAAAPAVPSTTPDAPTAFTVTPADSSARLTFTAPLSDGGAAITRYEAVVSADGDPFVVPLTITGIVLSSPVALSASQSATLTATLPGLTNGTRYRVQVRAVNIKGNGALTEPFSVVPALPTAPTLNGAASSTVAFGSTVTISGTAPAGSQVGIYFHGRGQTGYTMRRSIVVGSDGTYSTTYVATDDQRYYVQVGSQITPSVLTQVAPVVAGATTQTVARNSTVTIHGRGVAGTTVSVRFHKAGTAANDYSIVRRVTVAANGTFTRAFVASAAYRFYVTSDVNGTASANYLVQVK